MSLIDFFIHGEPAPGGSKTFIPSRRRDGSLVIVNRGGKPFPIGNMIDAGKHNKEWKDTVAGQADIAFKFQPIEHPIRVRFEFHVGRPKYHHVAGDPSRPLKDQYRDAVPDGPPDVTKFVRSTEDALTGIVWVDDSLIVQQEAEKVYAVGELTGCRIVVCKPIKEHVEPALFEGVANG